MDLLQPILYTQRTHCVTYLGGHENTAATRISATGTLPSGEDGSDAETARTPTVSGSPSTAATEPGQSSASSAARQSVPSPQECPRKALAGMLSNMMVLGPMTQDKDDRKNKKEDSDDDDDADDDGSKKKPKKERESLPEKNRHLR